MFAINDKPHPVVLKHVRFANQTLLFRQQTTSKLLEMIGCPQIPFYLEYI